ncbi:MAG: DNA-processing protein DprA [Chloroflexi bacterium]|nr:DNA-processing protein DprA [Chloroflexota bacterium]
MTNCSSYSWTSPYLSQSDPHYPPVLKTCLRDAAPAAITAFGDLGNLKNKTLALFCSQKCPGTLILQTYDLAQNLRQAGSAVIGGFHSPMEREALNILLRGKQPVIICPARSIEGMRLRAEFKRPLEQGQLLFLSPFPKKQKRMIADNAIQRNRFVGALAEAVFVAYAEPNGKMEQLCRCDSRAGMSLMRRKAPGNLDERHALIERIGAGAR